MKKLWRRWRGQRRALAEARKYLAQLPVNHMIASLHRQDLLALRQHFYQEKMGTWPERVHLYLLAAHLPAPATVVEIGAWVGVSTCYLGLGLRAAGGGKIYAVDTFLGTTLNEVTRGAWKKTVSRLGGSTLELFEQNIEALGLQEYVVAVVQTSAEAAQEWQGGELDLLYIDGDHVYEAVKLDYEGWADKVREGGWIVFHDYDERHPGVKRLVDEVLEGDLAGQPRRQVDSLLMVQK